MQGMKLCMWGLDETQKISEVSPDMVREFSSRNIKIMRNYL